jgi:hypothetical protein
MRDVPAKWGFDPPGLQKSPRNLSATFRNVFIRELRGS